MRFLFLRGALFEPFPGFGAVQNRDFLSDDDDDDEDNYVKDKDKNITKAKKTTQRQTHMCMKYEYYNYLMNILCPMFSPPTKVSCSCIFAFLSLSLAI